MGNLQRRELGRPSEARELPKALIKTFDLADGQVTWSSFEPGWRWSEAIKPLAGTDYCEFYHVGYTLSGRVHVETRDGAEMEIGPSQFYSIPPYHDAWVVGDEPWVSIDWGPGVTYGGQAAAGLERSLANILFTDIVDSTARARELGDRAWRDLLARHNGMVRNRLQRYGGREVSTTGDGFLALFDSAERAVRCGLAVAGDAPEIGIEVRAAVHTGEVEREGSDIRGLAVHLASRVVALAGGGEVLVSWTTRELLAGSGLELVDRGVHELKGLPEPKPIYAVASG